MMDLENRLRTTFTDMADEVPASANPRAELERRLATRSKSGWRTPALVAAAAAVVAAVAVPVVVFGGSGSTVPVGRDTTQPVAPTSRSQDAGDGRQRVVSHNDNGTMWTVYAIPGGVEVCAEPDPTVESCSQARFGVPPEGHLVLTFPMEPDGGEAHKLLLVTAPEVAELHVRDHAGEQVGLEILGSEGKSKIFVADFRGPTDGFGYTARDANGVVLEEALT